MQKKLHERKKEYEFHSHAQSKRRRGFGSACKDVNSSKKEDMMGILPDGMEYMFAYVYHYLVSMQTQRQ